MAKRPESEVKTDYLRYPPQRMTLSHNLYQGYLWKQLFSENIEGRRRPAALFSHLFSTSLIYTMANDNFSPTPLVPPSFPKSLYKQLQTAGFNTVQDLFMASQEELRAINLNALTSRLTTLLNNIETGYEQLLLSRVFEYKPKPLSVSADSYLQQELLEVFSTEKGLRNRFNLAISRYGLDDGRLKTLKEVGSPHGMKEVNARHFEDQALSRLTNHIRLRRFIPFKRMSFPTQLWQSSCMFDVETLFPKVDFPRSFVHYLNLKPNTSNEISRLLKTKGWYLPLAQTPLFAMFTLIDIDSLSAQSRDDINKQLNAHLPQPKQR